MNTFEVRYELTQTNKKPSVRRGFCIMSDRFLTWFKKTAEKKILKNDFYVDVDLTLPDPNITFFSDKGVHAINSNYISAWPVGQEPINLAHWKAFIIFESREWEIRDAVRKVCDA